MPYLSIVVPVYNKAPFLKDCILSILEQTFVDFEVLLINDGSTDESGRICDEYAQKDLRIRVYHQKNQGVSAARNSGIALATGSFIGFVDADDTIDAKMYEVLVTNALQYKADISVCGTRVIMAGKVKKNEDSGKVQCFTKDEAIAAVLESDPHWGFGVVNKIFRAAIAKNISFEGVVNEDVFFNFNAFIHSHINIIQYSTMYNYLVRNNSVSISKFSLNYMETIRLSKKIVELTEKTLPLHIDAAKAFDFSKHLSLASLFALHNNSQYANEFFLVKNHLLSYSRFLKGTNKIPKKEKIAFRLLKTNVGAFALFTRIYCIVFAPNLIQITR